MNKMRTIGKWVIPAATALLPFLVMANIVNPSATLTGQAITLTEIKNLIEGLARFLVVISIVVAVIFIVYGGIRWIMAGAGNEDAAKNARNIILNGIYGALVVLGVGVILQTLAGVVARSFFGTYQ